MGTAFARRPAQAAKERDAGARSLDAFHDPQINLYVADVERSVRFNGDAFGFRESFRTPKTGTPIHVEMRLGPLVRGFGSIDSLREIHGLDVRGGSPRAEVVLWTEDVDRAYEAVQAKGGRPLSPAHDFLTNLRAAWVADPDGNPIQIVTRRSA